MGDNYKRYFDSLKENHKIYGDAENFDSYLALKQEINAESSNEPIIKNYDFKKEKRKNFLDRVEKEVVEIRINFFPTEYHTIEKWIKFYVIARYYYKEHHHLVPVCGEIYEINGISINIYNWVLAQRTKYNAGALNENQKYLLDQIGMNWDCHKKVEEIVEDDVDTSKESQKSA